MLFCYFASDEADCRAAKLDVYNRSRKVLFSPLKG